MAQLITPRTEDEENKRLADVRREKLREIADQITFARDRGFGEDDKYVAAKGLELARQVDVEHMVNAGLLKDPDLFWTRNWWTGDQEQITIERWKKAMEDGFWLRQSLRMLEQSYRNQVKAIYRDDKKTVAERADEIEHMEVPPFLGLPETDVKRSLERLHQT